MGTLQESRGASEGLRSTPASGAQQQPPQLGISEFSPDWPDMGWGHGTHREPLQHCWCGEQEGMCAMLQSIAGSS